MFPERPPPSWKTQIVCARETKVVSRNSKRGTAVRLFEFVPSKSRMFLDIILFCTRSTESLFSKTQATEGSLGMSVCVCIC